ncbi:unnamed protein product [Rotaria sp. Silwood2]|nr:unnamed protein product [Rotaria sp. Silwood2]CAF3187945.1 unnamed protein product [Rotaria sp. Silwood2]CAF4079563.1 unnamed protein product [Rotaria sp. Silwood2]
MKDIIELLDLPDEMILNIMNKVKPQALLFCSVINIGNNRLERLALDKCHSIDLSFDYQFNSHELLLKRFYIDVLPHIYNNIQSLTINIKHFFPIHAALQAMPDKLLPNLRHLKILKGRRHRYTGTPFTIGIHYDLDTHDWPLFSTVPQSVHMEVQLIDSVLLFIRWSPLMHSIKSFEFDHDVVLVVPVNNDKLFFAKSSYLTHVSITLLELSDCVRLLNELGSQLHSFIVSIMHVCLDDEDIISEIEAIYCYNLKELKMTMYRNIINYEQLIIPLLQHLSSVEHLTLLLAIYINESDRFIDGFHLERNIVSYMPHLRQFNFHIRSILQDSSYIEVDTIRQSFINQQSADCTIDCFNNQYSQCHIYSLPFIGNRLDFISNRFPLFDINNTFSMVTILLLFDDVQPFESDFFIRVFRALPHLRTLEISNQLEQEEKTKTITDPVEYSHLSTLILHKIHIDYGKQLLCRAHLPHLVELVIRNDVLLTIIDQDNQQARNNCLNVETLFIVEPWIEPRSVHLKFFPKLYMENL